MDWTSRRGSGAFIAHSRSGPRTSAGWRLVLGLGHDHIEAGDGGPNHAGLVLLDQGAALLTHREGLGGSVGVPAHRVEGPRKQAVGGGRVDVHLLAEAIGDRKSTRLNSSHLGISYAV